MAGGGQQRGLLCHPWPQEEGWLPSNEELLELPAFQRAALIDEAGLELEGSGPLVGGGVLYGRLGGWGWRERAGGVAAG